MQNTPQSYLLQALQEYKPEYWYTLHRPVESRGMLESLIKAGLHGGSASHLLDKDGFLSRYSFGMDARRFETKLQEWLSSNALTKPCEVRRRATAFPHNRSGCWHIWDEVERVTGRYRMDYPEYFNNPAPGIASTAERS